MPEPTFSVDLEALRTLVAGLSAARTRWDDFDRLDGLDRSCLARDELFRAFGHFAKDWDGKRHKVRDLVDQATMGLEQVIAAYEAAEAEIARAMRDAAG